MRQEQVNTATGKPILVIEYCGIKKTTNINSHIFSIGRYSTCNLVLNDKSISRYHATIAWLKDLDHPQKKAYWIIDGKNKNQRSKNGVFVNGVKTVLHRLRSGDVITLGTDVKITYTYIADTTENLQIADTIYYL